MRHLTMGRTRLGSEQSRPATSPDTTPSASGPPASVYLMSIVVAVASPEGFALVTDSRTTVERKEQDGSVHYRVASESSEKLFLAQGRFGVATYGLATIGGRTI